MTNNDEVLSRFQVAIRLSIYAVFFAALVLVLFIAGPNYPPPPVLG